jgi:predicted ATPase
MRAFLEQLADRAEGVALLLVCAARPELFERDPTFGAGLHSFTRLNLTPLSDDETARLISGLLDSSTVPEALRDLIIERAEGNPLYVEEFLRLLKDQNLLTEADGSWALGEKAEVPLPGSIQALIAARLDTLSPERKAMLADAAVVGKVFWAGAVAEMGNRPLTEVTDALRELSRRELVRPARSSSMAGEPEYAFWHVLTRDVAYAQLPRASRASRHVAAATWLEAKAGERVEDIAEVLAHHYASALQLARAGRSEQAAELEAPALRFLTLAGEKTLNLDVATARSLFRQALELAPKGQAGRARALRLLAQAETSSGNITAAVGLYEEAVAAYEAAGDRAAAAVALLRLSSAVADAGDPSQSESIVDQVIARLEGEGPSELLARAYTSKQFHHQDDLSWSDRALAIAEELDLPEVRNRALSRSATAGSWDTPEVRWRSCSHGGGWWMRPSTSPADAPASPRDSFSTFLASSRSDPAAK